MVIYTKNPYIFLDICYNYIQVGLYKNCIRQSTYCVHKPTQNKNTRNGMPTYKELARRNSMQVDEKFIAERISQLRNQKKVSARDMSLSLGQSESYINKIENGWAMPSIAGMLYICEYFGITPAEFFSQEIEAPKLTKELLTMINNLSQEKIRVLIELLSFFQKIKNDFSFRKVIF